MTSLEETINYFKDQGSMTPNGDIVASLSYIQKYKNKVKSFSFYVIDFFSLRNRLSLNHIPSR